MKHSDNIKAIAAALVAVQREVTTIVKDSVNPHYKAHYASLETITETVRPLLTAEGIALIQGGTSVTDEAGNVKAVTVETMLLHSSGEWISNAVTMPLEKANAQGVGSAITYGRRYGLSALLSLTTDEDDDGQAASTKPAAKAAPKPATIPKATAEQVAKIRELAKVTGDTAAIESSLPGLTQDKAGEWIARLTIKADKVTQNA